MRSSGPPPPAPASRPPPRGASRASSAVTGRWSTCARPWSAPTPATARAGPRGGGPAGRGRVVARVGGAGVGKSRLVWEVTHTHRAQASLILESASVSYGKATPYL